MIRDPAPFVVAYDLQAALIRCGIKVEDRDFIDASGAAMGNVVRAWLYGLRKVATDQRPDDPGAALLELVDRLAAPFNPIWEGNNEVAVRNAVEGVGREGRDACARFGRGMNFPPSRDSATTDAVSLDPPCAYGQVGCGNRQLAGTRYATRQPWLKPGWLPADAGQGLTPAALAHLANESDATAPPDSSAASPLETSASSVPEPEVDAARNRLATNGASATVQEPFEP